MTDKLPDWNDADVQVVYDILCGTERPPNPAEHWEGYLARLIVGKLNLEAQRDALQQAQRDALRYRWLRMQGKSQDALVYGMSVEDGFRGVLLDRYIDAANKEKP